MSETTPVRARVPYTKWAEVICRQNFYITGESFRAADVRPAIDRATDSDAKLNISSIYSILKWMGQEGYLTIGEDDRGRKYRRKRKCIADGPWRKHTNAKLGVKSQHCGSLYQWVK